MSATAVNCQDERRRGIVAQGDYNGIDYLEVGDDQVSLFVYFLGRAPDGLTPAHIRIDGGRRVTGIRVDDVRLSDSGGPEYDACLRITVDKAGDFSTYTLRLVNPDENGRPGTEPLEGFDPRYASIAFSFKANCPSDLDCAPVDPCPPPSLIEPAISYLAKDYASFRQLILDRLALIMPGWTDRHVPDLGITLVELLAYTGDYLSYYQDAVATEAYLATARRRISVRRHVRLVDYPMHDGCNARAWVCVEVAAPLPLDAKDFYFITGANDLLPVANRALSRLELCDVAATAYEVFEPIVPAGAEKRLFELRPEHNAIPFWTWGDAECCLPAGATSATLRDELVDAPSPNHNGGKGGKGRNGAKQTSHAYGEPQPPPPSQTRALDLKAGDVLIFEEILGPHTGVPGDADRRHRQAVRLTKVEPGIDALYNDQPIVEITWAVEDALRFPLCLSAVDQECKFQEPVSVARGNVILVDHGRSVPRCNEPPRVWPTPPGRPGPASCDCVGTPGEPTLLPETFAPVLPIEDGVITQRTPFPLPADIARRQADGLATLLADALAWARDRWRQARGGDSLSDADRQTLERLFGRRALAECGLASTAESNQAAPDDQARGLYWLLANEERLLAKQRRWLETLVRRAAGGSILTADQLEDIAAVFGTAAARALDPASPTVWGPASTALTQDPTEALPVVALEYAATEDDPPLWWTPRRDLLGSNGRDRHFVGELDGDGLHLRFGDGVLGMAVPPGIELDLWTRIGSGAAGNIGAEAIAHIVFCGLPQHAVRRVRNPLPATGGIEPEPLAEVKLYAPSAFRRRLRRAITAADYATLAGETPGVQRAAATLRWTGSWYEAEVAIDPIGSQEASPTLLATVAGALHRARRIGHDLTVQTADYVPLDIALLVCVEAHVHRAHVKQELLNLLSNRSLPDGRRGFFHPDNLTFGDDIALSTLVSLVHAVPGVSSVEVTKLERLSEGPAQELAEGILRLGSLEIARLDNDRARPENGVLTIDVRGGR